MRREDIVGLRGRRPGGRNADRARSEGPLDDMKELLFGSFVAHGRESTWKSTRRVRESVARASEGGCDSFKEKTAVEKKIPTSRLGRFAQLASLGVRTGAGMLLKKEADDAGAAKALLVLGRLRGLAAKVGQMASYVDGVVPEGQRDVYEGALKLLRSQAPRSTAHEIRSTIEKEIGAPIDMLFSKFEDTPVASASMGQVHKAWLPDGTTVAVKVQHAGIREAVEADLGNIKFLDGFSAVMGAGRFETKKFVDVVSTRFREELDYELEATHTERFAEIHANDPTIRIPKVYRSHSSKSVLTTEFMSGLDIDEAALRPEAERKAWAETLWRFVFKGTLVGGRFNADPHPGNYFFQENGVVVFLDHGCVQTLPEDHLIHAREMHRAGTRGDEPKFRESMDFLIGARPGALEQAAYDYTRICFEPLFGSPYRITRDWAASLVSQMKDMGQLARTVPDDQFFNLPADMIFMNRLQFGFYSVLARLDVAADYASVERGFLG